MENACFNYMCYVNDLLDEMLYMSKETFYQPDNETISLQTLVRKKSCKEGYLNI